MWQGWGSDAEITSPSFSYAVGWIEGRTHGWMNGGGIYCDRTLWGSIGNIETILFAQTLLNASHRYICLIFTAILWTGMLSSPVYSRWNNCQSSWWVSARARMYTGQSDSKSGLFTPRLHGQFNTSSLWDSLCKWKLYVGCPDGSYGDFSGETLSILDERKPWHYVVSMPSCSSRDTDSDVCPVSAGGIFHSSPLNVKTLRPQAFQRLAPSHPVKGRAR